MPRILVTGVRSKLAAASFGQSKYRSSGIPLMTSNWRHGIFDKRIYLGYFTWQASKKLIDFKSRSCSLSSEQALTPPNIQCKAHYWRTNTKGSFVDIFKKGLFFYLENKIKRACVRHYQIVNSGKHIQI